jgi:hypothetical protein
VTRNLRLALITFVVGFLTEAVTEIYQYVSYGPSRPAWVGLYYLGLATTGLGFYFMYRARREWTELHHRNVHRGHRLFRVALVLFLGTTVAIAIIASLTNGGRSASTPTFLAAPVGGLVALAFGNFFLGLALLVDRIAGSIGRGLAWSGFAWSLVVAVWTGLLVGRQFSQLLLQFFTNPLGLFVSFGPIAFAIAPLFVSYLLMSAAYLEAYRRLARSAGQREAPAASAS